MKGTEPEKSTPAHRQTGQPENLRPVVEKIF
jgi:hypothetical protein